MDQPLIVLEAAAIRDAAGTAARPGAVAVRAGRIVAAGSRTAVATALGDTRAERVDLGDVLLLPAFVNAHAHLDLTAIGPRAFEGSFVAWAEMVMRARPTGDDAVTAAVSRGLALSREAGVGWIGDIAGDERAVLARAAAGDARRVPGVSWLECFGIGARDQRGAERAEARLLALRSDPAVRASGLRVDLQPHAPYSAGLAVYARAAALGRPSTHLAETREELEFVASARGPFAEFLRRIGRWDDSIEARRTTPVQAAAELLTSAPWVLAHCNHLDDDDVALLARSSCTVAYCPIASEYFGHENHPYRRLLDAGVPVCLGTDSILCQPEGETQPLGIWPQMRRLWLRDGVEPDVLLAMATVHGAAALALEPGTGTFAAGAPARITAVVFDAHDPADPLRTALRASTVVRPGTAGTVTPAQRRRAWMSSSSSRSVGSW